MFWCLKFGHPNYHINEKVEVFIWLCISLYFFYLKCYFITFLTSSQPYYNYFLVFSCQVQANLFALFSFIKSPSKTGYIPYSLIFKLEDSKDSNCISHNKYIHTQSKEVNRSHFLSYATSISITLRKISEWPHPLFETVSSQTYCFI